ncbi:hypothetical protein MFIFM68171_05158 [Madurella fahalii]|uniref:Uncharacterized protein n=1 Tax=Madurella fahalii TaxID=1157608 RepID=A0ABQ0GB14_9PEZI
MGFLKGEKSPSSEALLPVDAREKASSVTQSPNSLQRPAPVSKMACVRRLVVGFSVCMLVLLGVASAASPRLHCRKGAMGERQTAVDTDDTSFSSNLKSASPSSLNELLHRYLPGRFRDGVWPSELQAVKAVHQADAALATSIVQLAKRADNNSTTSESTPAPTESSTTSEEPSSTSTSPSSSSSPTPSETATPPTSTTSSPTRPTSASSTSSPPPPGTSSSPIESTLSTSSETSSEPLSSSSSSQPSSTIVGETTLTTSTVSDETTPPPRTSREIIQTFTSTSDGVVVVVTATTYVPAGPEETLPPNETRPAPSLQNSALQKLPSLLTAGMVGFAAAAMLLV